MTRDQITASTLYQTRVVIPGHTVFRAFSEETVALNTVSGEYHGLKGSGGRMIEALAAADTVGEAFERLSMDFDEDEKQIWVDLSEFCQLLEKRDLIRLLHGS